MTLPIKTTEAPADAASCSRLASVEGYIALVLVASMCLHPFAFRGISAGLVMGVVLWGCAWLFAISGSRRGTGAARVAAILSLVVLVLHATLCLIIAAH